MKYLLSCFMALSFGFVKAQVWPQSSPVDSAQVQTLDAVILNASRAKAEDPITQSNLSAEDLAPINMGQDFPYLLRALPGVVTTSDAGAGVGYTGLRVRGSDATRVNVSINGIPYNDAESQGVYWVNLPDLASSVDRVQLQRGVGSSTYGPGSFGASLNLWTGQTVQEAGVSMSSAFGSFNTQKHTLKFSTGPLTDGFSLSGRLSKINSDGYIDRASSDLAAYYLEAGYQDQKTKLKVLAFGGQEETYQSWYGIDQATLATDRTYNPAGIQFDESGNFEGFYDSQIDRYNQDHIQLLWSQDLANHWTSQISMNYTHGRGYYQEYVDQWYSENVLFSDDANLALYGLSPVVLEGQVINSSDLVRRRWLNNNFYATNGHVTYADKTIEWTSGAFYSYYGGDHFGEVVWARYASDSEPGQRYYSGNGDKNEGSLFSKLNWQLSQKWQIYADLQQRWISYRTSGIISDGSALNVRQQYDFFNPKFGATYRLNQVDSFYASFGRSHREPRRSDFEQGVFTPERLDDIELGWRRTDRNINLSATAYYMNYKNQLVLTGAIDDVGAPIRGTSGDSYRMGLEVEALWQIDHRWSWQVSLALSENKNRDYVTEFDGVLQNLGQTDISFAPGVIGSSVWSYQTESGWRLAWFAKHVGAQYMGNTERDASRLAAYMVNDLQVSYDWQKPWLGKTMSLKLLLNNILSADYVSNGYYYTFDDDYSNPGVVQTIEGAGYYPQALANGLIGLTIEF